MCSSDLYVANRGVLFTLVDILSGENFTVTDEFAIEIFFLVKDTELVAESGVEYEIDYTTEDVCHLHNRDRRNPLPLTGHKQAVGNGADFEDRKSTRLNSSHKPISYAVFCLKKKK